MNPPAEFPMCTCMAGYLTQKISMFYLLLDYGSLRTKKKGEYTRLTRTQVFKNLESIWEVM